MAQRISQIKLLVGDEVVRVEIYGENGSELVYSGSSEAETVQMFNHMCTNLRKDMDKYELVPSGSVYQEFSDAIDGWSDFSDVLDDLYLGIISNSVQEWCEALCDEAFGGPVAYVSEIRLAFAPDSRNIHIDLCWDSSDDNWNRYGLDNSNGCETYCFDDTTELIGVTLRVIAEHWASSFSEKGIAYAETPNILLPESGPDVNINTLSAAFCDLWNGNIFTSSVKDLEEYIRECMYSSVPGGYIESVEIGIDPNNDASLLMRVTWNTYENSEWNAVIPSERQGYREYSSENYDSIQNMFDVLSRELVPTFDPDGIEYNPDIVGIRFSAMEGPVITESELNLALKDLFQGTSHTNYVYPVADKLQQMLNNHLGYPISSIVYSINDFGGEIVFCADNFEASYSICNKDSLLATFNEIARSLAEKCDNSYVVFDPNLGIELKPEDSNAVDLSLSGYDHDKLLNIFYSLYEGNVTDGAERLANWVASM